MVMKCDEVLPNLSDYIDGSMDSVRGAAMKEHFGECPRCQTVLEGTRNVIALYEDEKMQEVPFGFEQRLHRRIASAMHRSNGTSLGWLVLVAATVLVAGSFEIATSKGVPRPLRSEHAHPAGESIPRGMMVVVAEGTNTFHLAGCRYIHENSKNKSKLRTIPAEQAQAEGFVPCVRCLGEYLSRQPSSDSHSVQEAEARPRVRP